MDGDFLENIFTYLKWRGDLSFNESSFNEVDNLILCALTYLKMDLFLNSDDVISIKDFSLKYKEVQNNESLLKKNQSALIDALSTSKRFENIVIARFVNEVEEEEEKQFCAMTFILPNNQLFIAFKGTDETITGWKENLNMSYMKVIPAQLRAKEYLEEILLHTKKRVFVGGHSKGGNLAMYASINCNENLKSKIIQVYNNDGPGLNSAIRSKNRDINNKIITFIPKASVVGNIFDNATKIILIESSQIGILQHDLYSWGVIGSHFVYAKEIDDKTKNLSNSLNQTLNKLPIEKKENIINFLYDLVTSLGIYDIEKTVQSILQNNVYLKKYHLSLEDNSILWEVIPIVIKIIKSLSL